jgi:DNA ligase (NAD+)
LEKARNWGFKVPNESKLAKNLTKFLISSTIGTRNETHLPYETDGVVIKVNNFRHQEEMGYTAKSPKLGYSL